MMKRAAKKESFVQEAPSAPKAAERTWYTVRWKYKDPLEGQPIGGAVEVIAPGMAAAKAEVKRMLDKEGRKWQGLTVEEGQRLPKPPPARDYNMDMLARSIMSGDGRPIAARPGVTDPDHAHIHALLTLWGTGPMNTNGDKVRAYLDKHGSESFKLLVGRITKGLKRMAQTWPSDRWPVVSWGELAEVLDRWHGDTGQGTNTTNKPKPAKARPTHPTIAEKFDKVPGSLDKWMDLLRAEGLVDEDGQFAMASDVKGKGKLIAAWDAAQSVFRLPTFPSNAALVRALNVHVSGLEFSGRLDRVRFTNDFDTIRDDYKVKLG